MKHLLQIPRFYYNLGSTPEALKDLTKSNIQKIWIISDPNSWKKYGKKLSKFLKNNQLKFMSSSVVNYQLTFKNIKNNLTTITQFQPDLIMAFGDKKAINQAKLISYVYQNPEKNFLSLENNEIANPCQLMVIPTTHNDLSALTSFAKCKNDQNENILMNASVFLPKMVIIDSNFQLFNNQKDIISMCIHALVNAFESLFSKNSTMFTASYARESIFIILENLMQLAQNSNYSLDLQTLIHANALAGIAVSNTSSYKINSLASTINNQNNIDGILLLKLLEMKRNVLEQNCSTIIKNFCSQESLEIFLKEIYQKLSLPVWTNKLLLNSEAVKNINQFFEANFK